MLERESFSDLSSNINKVTELVLPALKCLHFQAHIFQVVAIGFDA
jgi:hypothetical protein